MAEPELPAPTLLSHPFRAGQDVSEEYTSRSRVLGSALMSLGLADGQELAELSERPGSPLSQDMTQAELLRLNRADLLTSTFLDQFKRGQQMPSAVHRVQANWRMRVRQKRFSRIIEQKRTRLRAPFEGWAMVVRAERLARRALLRQCMRRMQAEMRETEGLLKQLARSLTHVVGSSPTCARWRNFVREKKQRDDGLLQLGAASMEEKKGAPSTVPEKHIL